jgi:hypothetical protein
MPYNWTDMTVGLSPVATVDDVQKFPIGTVKKAFDSSWGEGEFIYLPGVAGVVAGHVVNYDTVGAGSTTRTVAATRGPLAVAMAAVVAATWGWFQIKGAARVSVPAGIVAGTPAYVTAVGGQVDDTVAAGQGIDNAIFKSVDAAGLATLQIDRPSASGAF